MLSEDGTNLFSVWISLAMLRADVEDGSCIWKIAPGEWETKETNGFRKILPVKDEKAVLITKKGIFYIDWKKQQLIREMKNDAEEDFLSERDRDGACCTVSGTNLAIANGHYLWCMTWRVENVSSRVSMTRRNIVQIRRMRLRLMKRQKMYFLRLE